MDQPGDGRVRNRLWKAGGLVAAFILTLWTTNFLLPADKQFDSHMYGHDFLPFYTAGQLIRMGRADWLYDPRITRVLEHETCREAGLVIHNEYGAFLNPPFAALPAEWLAAWPYRTALAIWTVILLLCLAASVGLLARMLPAETDWRTWGLAPLLLLAALPVWQAAIHAQNTFVSLLILSATVALWRNGRSFAAGAVAGLLLFKPQLAAVVIAVLVISRGWRAAAGAVVTAAGLLLVNLIALPGTIGGYLHQLPLNLRAIQMLPNYTWQRHVTFLAWWRILLQGHVGALPSTLAYALAGVSMAAIGVILAATVWRARNDPRRTDRVIAAAIAAGPLLMPYYMDYDLTLLSVAAVLCAGDAIRRGVDRGVLAAWIAFYVVAEFNPPIAGNTRVIPDVPMLALLACVLIGNARQRIADEATMPAAAQQLRAAA